MDFYGGKENGQITWKVVERSYNCPKIGLNNKIMYYLQYLVSKFKSNKIHKHVSPCSQCSPLPTGWDSWIQTSGLNKQMERISAHRLYYVIVKLVCKAHSGVTWREFRKHSQKSLQNGQNTV